MQAPTPDATMGYTQASSEQLVEVGSVVVRESESVEASKRTDNSLYFLCNHSVILVISHLLSYVTVLNVERISIVGDITSHSNRSGIRACITSSGASAS